MPFPVTAASVQAIIPAASASWCEKLLQYPLRLGYLAIDALKFMVNPDGTVTDEFKAWIGVEVGGVTPGQVPTGVSATDGTHLDKVVVTWNFPGTATQYKVYRAADPTSTTPDLIQTVTTTTYEDHPPGAAGTAYAYFVKATVNGVDSALSTADMGFVGTGSTPPPGTTILVSNGFTSFTIPADGDYVLEVWGPGGGGGPSFVSSAWASGEVTAKVRAGSGGGGGRASLRVTLKKDDLMVGGVGQGGHAGTGDSQTNTQGGDGGITLMSLSRGGVIYEVIKAFGGTGAKTNFGDFAPGAGGGAETPATAPTFPSELGLNPTASEVSPGNPGQRGEVLPTPPPNPLPPPLPGGSPTVAPPPEFPTAGNGGTGATQYVGSSYPSSGGQGNLGCVRIRTI